MAKKPPKVPAGHKPSPPKMILVKDKKGGIMEIVNPFYSNKKSKDDDSETK